MKGKHVAITGPTAGIGRAAALELARRGASLTLLCRDATKGMALQAEIAEFADKPEVVTIDMASLASVRSAAEAMLSTDRPLDVLLNNAGVVNTARRTSVDGFEETFAVNHLAPFLLTGLLLPLLQQAPRARIVTVASDAHTFVRGLGWEDMQAERSYKTFREYGRSKLANILFTRALARRLRGTDITANCLHPGAVATSLGSNNGPFGSIVMTMLKPFIRSPERGAETSVYLCSSSEVASISGGYFANCREKQPKPWAQDDAEAERLWQYSEECTTFAYPL
jgi:NAD(P)-dependent dehydrogenase (short-subunit alcohol dehydrogenase family)